MDKDTRNRIQRATQAARGLLEQDFEDQLAGVFDIRLDGTIAGEPGSHLDAAQRIVRNKLVAAVEHGQCSEFGVGSSEFGVGSSEFGVRSSGLGIRDSEEQGRRAEAVAGFLREAAFTTLNRFVALKMLEARGLVQECISRGEQSSGFKEFCGLAPGLVQLPDRGYRLYIESLFDEIGREVRVLFDRRDPASLLWPARATLFGSQQPGLLEILNDPELAGVWEQDETIGWVYQYYNDPSERKRMRDESAVPRNSRELAVRNQFFTPRYVVEFLTDNSLGRVWYEMRQGNTALVERCAYLVLPRDPLFLAQAFGPDEQNTQDWILGHAAGAPPDPVWLGHTVSGYARHVLDHATAQWVDAQLAAICDQGDLRRPTQQLFDLLFLLCRGDRFCDGLLDSKKDQVRALIDAIAARLHPRVYRDATAKGQSHVEIIRHRPPKDPRDLRILDPACGSGHFLLYAFDLLIIVYEEAWTDAELGPPLWRDLGLPALDTKAPTPIDPATVQLDESATAHCFRCGSTLRPAAALLVLADLDDTKRLAGRPLVYCAACSDEQADRCKLVMPLPQFSYLNAILRGWFEAGTGEGFLALARVFRFQRVAPGATDGLAQARSAPGLAHLRRQLPGLILRHNLHGIDIDPRAAQIASLALWLRAQRAFEELGIPRGERAAITRTNIVCAEPMPGEPVLRREFIASLAPDLGRLLERVFERMALAGEVGSLLRIEEDIRVAVREIYGEQGPLFRVLDEERWQRAERAVLHALREYAERASNGHAYRRRLFSEDAARGFGFIDLCGLRFDVTLMNPPFGAPCARAGPYLAGAYPRSKGDLLAACVERGVQWLHPAGILGAITSRTPLFLTSYRHWRQGVLLGEARPTVLADLGHGVMDAAMVEAAAYCLIKQ